MTSLNIDEFKAVIFDLDSTLMDSHQYPMVASEWLMKNSQVDIEKYRDLYLRNLVTRYFKGIQAVVEGAPFVTPLRIIKNAMSSSLQDIGYDVDMDLVEQATQRFRSLHIKLATPYPGVSEILHNLESRGIRMGILTNSFEGNAPIILENSKLLHFFIATVDCGDVQAYKPMSAPFERILALLDVTPSEALYVGDEYYADMVGGKQSNLTTVWINQRNNSLEDFIIKYGPENTPDIVLKSITEFAEML